VALDPYKPPAARVEDRGEDEELAGRPRQVTLACYILVVAVVIGLAAWLPDSFREMADAAHDGEEVGEAFLYVAIVLAAIFTVAYGVLIYLIGRRNNFARWALLFLLALGWLVTAGYFFETLEESAIEAAAEVVVVAAELWACYLLFLSPAAAWFKPRADPR
jgi:hypothetical protein